MANPTLLNVLPLEQRQESKETLANKKSKEDSLKPNYSRDENLTDFGKATLLDRYLLPGEKFQDMFLRVARCYSDNDQHAERIYEYISKLWFMPATPVLSNGGAKEVCQSHVF